jgi:hypothetical protein
LNKKVLFYKNYSEAEKRGNDIKQQKEYDLSSDKTLKDYLELLRKVVKEEKGGTYHIPPEMFKTIRNKYIHLSSHYGGLKNDFLDIKGGDHHWLGSIGFVNHPVKYTVDGDFVKYKREIYANK